MVSICLSCGDEYADHGDPAYPEGPYLCYSCVDKGDAFLFSTSLRSRQIWHLFQHVQRENQRLKDKIALLEADVEHLLANQKGQP